MIPTLLRRLWFLIVCSSAVAATPVAPIVAVPRFTHPGAGQVFYFVLTDRFANGRTDNDTGGHPGGPDQHGFDPTRIGFYHGGDFAGLTAKLDYIKRLGATAVWITPPFVNKPMQTGSAGYHGYWVLDFLHIDPHLGSDADFREFVTQAHARGLKIFGATLTPFWGANYYTDAGEAKRAAINEWIRNGKAYDGVIDFDKATRDPGDPKKLFDRFDSCDYLHPSDAGYKAMGDAIDLSLFKGRTPSTAALRIRN